MSNKKFNALSQVKPQIFEPKYLRYDPKIYISSDFSAKASTKNDLSIDNPDAFLGETYGGLVSTSQIGVDYTDFANFVFFDSAVSKVNIAFEKIIKGYPFDSSAELISEYLESLTGYENYILSQFPKSKNYLHFSGSAATSESAGTNINIVDRSGINNFSEIPASGDSVLSPGKNGLTIEFFINVPNQSNGNQIIFQGKEPGDSDSRHMTLSIPSSTSTSASIIFDISSGSSGLVNNTISANIDKGSFFHLSFVFDNNEETLKVFKDGILHNQRTNISPFQEFSFTKDAKFTIGSGSFFKRIGQSPINFLPTETFSGSLDEFRYFKSARSDDNVKDYFRRNVFIGKADRRGHDLGLYFRFNEPSGSYSGNNYVIDYSGNGLHSTINNYSNSHRDKLDGSTPITQERLDDNPVLFSGYESISSLNNRLLNSGSDYDNYNPNLITKLIPQHYFLDGQIFDGLSNITGSLSNRYDSSFPGVTGISQGQLLTSFLLIFAKFYDELKIYIDTLSRSLTVEYDDNDSAPANFLRYAAKRQGLTLPNIFDGNIKQFKQRLEIDNIDEISERSLFEIQNEMWKRIVLTTQRLNSKKGTLESVKSLIRSIGVDPDIYFDIKEYGGPKRRFLDDRRKTVKKKFNYLDMSGSFNYFSGSIKKESCDYHGLSPFMPYIRSNYLSASRYEIGFPEPQGTYVPKFGFKHGESNNADDTLLTSGSFTIEGIFRYPLNVKHQHPVSQSFFRLATTGSIVSAEKSLVLNTVFVSGSKASLTVFLDSERRSTGGYNQFNLTTASIDNVDIFNGNDWYVSAGIIRSDDPYYRENIVSSSVLFVRCFDLDRGELLKSETPVRESIRHYPGTFVNVLREVGGNFNTFGPFLETGFRNLNSSGSTKSLFLCKNQYDNSAKTTVNTSEINFLKFWSKALTEKEAMEHARNIGSKGVDKPNFQYNHDIETTGSFNKMRMDVAIAHQITTGSDSSGQIILFDNSQNGFHMTGSNFEANAKILKRREYRYDILAPKFDENSSEEKVRVRSYSNDKNLSPLGNNSYAQRAPVFQVPLDGKTQPDNRFSIDMSCVKALDEDIMKMFSSLEYFDDYLGDPRNLYQDNYPRLSHIRNIYFNDLLRKIDIDANSKFFNWFDEAFTQLIHQFIPMRANFLGVNYVIESHVLERSRFRYLSDNQYVIRALTADDLEETSIGGQSITVGPGANI